MSRGDIEGQRIWFRSLVVRELLTWLGDATGLDEFTLGHDLPADKDRRRWEQRLGLKPGALGWKRYSGEFSGRSAAQVANLLLAEARNFEPDDAKRRSGTDLILDVIDYAGTEPERTLWLTGSEDVAAELEPAGLRVVYVGSRHRPSADMLERYDLATNCRGPKHHKDFWPWERPIKRMKPGTGPLYLISTSSNIGGIASFMDTSREQLRRYVRQRRAA